MTTRRENLVALLRGDRPDWTPCSINFNQWYCHHLAFDDLPSELSQTENYIDAMKTLGCDIFSRNLDGGVRVAYENVEVETEQKQGQQGTQTLTTMHTPYGDLQSIAEEQPAISTSYQVKDLISDWSAMGKAYLWLLEHKRYTWDRQTYLKTDAQVGEDGVVLVPVGCTPLKQLHWDFGLDHASLFVIDEPEAAQTCCRLHWKALWPVLGQLAADKTVHSACLMDNVDTPFYPPALCKHYWTPYVRQAADLFESHGKRLLVHACGKLRQLKQVFRESAVHGLEGMAHPPLGDWTIPDLREMPEGFIYNGGFSAHEQDAQSDTQVQSFYRTFFSELQDYPFFIFASACQTAVNTPWSRLKLVVQLCRQLSQGRAPS